MLNIRDKVKFNLDALEEIGWEGLIPSDNTNNKDYKSYIRENIDNIFQIYNIDESCSHIPYQIDDEFLKETSFSKEELIKIEVD